MFEIGALVTGIQAGLSSLSTLMSARDEAKVREAIQDISTRFSELQTALVLGNEKLLDVTQRNNELLTEISKLRTELANREHYFPVNIANGGGVFWALLDKREAGSIDPGGEPKKYVCQACLQNGKRLLLRFEGAGVVCDGCGLQAVIDHEAVARNTAALASRFRRSRGHDPYEGI